MDSVTLNYAQSHLGKLITRAEGGDTVCITLHGKPVAQIVAIVAPRKPIDVAALQALTDTMGEDKESARAVMARMRDDERA